jgi:HD-GYP domain-containing protein (c-di-GMP phosphodiesterase class II)
VQNSLFHVYDRWRGKTRPEELNGEDVPVGARIARLTGIAVLFESIGGSDLAVQAVRRRAGGMLDPDLAARFTGNAAKWLTDLPGTGASSAVLELEPHPHVTVPGLRLAGEVFGDLADLKGPYFVGHSRAVAALAAGAAGQLLLSEGIKTDLEVAGLLHDVGRVAVSNAVWEKHGPLSTDQWEQVRLHPYPSERILAGSAELARLAPLAGRHRDRLDGSGYHRGCSGEELTMPARILAAADTYRALTERRPHRAAWQPEQAKQHLLGQVSRGALDADAVRAVLAAAGHLVPSRPGICRWGSLTAKCRCSP